MKHMVVVEQSREGGFMTRISGKVAFPDKKHSIPRGVEFGSVWEVEVTGSNHKGTVSFFRFVSEKKGTIEKIYVLDGFWGTKWFWRGESVIPDVSDYEGRKYKVSEGTTDGKWEAMVLRLGGRPINVTPLKYLASKEEMLVAEEKIERKRLGGFLEVEVQKALKEALSETKQYTRVDGRDLAWYLAGLNTGEILVDSVEQLLLLMRDNIKAALDRKSALVVLEIDATRQHSVYWHYKRAGCLYFDHVRTLPTATAADVKDFLLVSVENPNMGTVGRGYVDQY